MERYDQLFDAVSRLTDDGLCLCEMVVDADGRPSDYRFLKVNHRFEDYTGLRDATGRTALEMVPELEAHWVETYARVGLGGETLRFEQVSEAMGRHFAVNATPAEPEGRLMIFFRDITARKQAEAARERALAESERLFDELGHRVKNSLAVIAAIVKTEARVASPEAQVPLERVGARIEAVAGLYEAIGASGSVDRVEARAYLRQIVTGLGAALTDDRRIRIEPRLSEMWLPSRSAVSVGMIVNELVTNSVKHAFPGGRSGAVEVALERAGEVCRLTVQDDGAGDMVVAGEPAPGGMGGRLVAAFVADLDGRMERASGADGTRTVIEFTPGAVAPPS